MTEEFEDYRESAAEEARSVPPPMSRSVTHGVTRRGIVTLLGTIVGAALMFVNEILCARFLGLHDYGLYALANVFARVGEGVSQFGVGTGILHFIPLYRQRGEMGKLKGTLILAVVVPLLVGAVLVVAMWLASPALARWIAQDATSVPYFRWFAFAIPLLGLSEICGRITRGFGTAVYHVVIRDLVPRVVYMVLLLVLIISQPHRYWIAAVFAASYGVASLVGLISTWHVSRDDVRNHVADFPIRELAWYSFPAFVTMILALVMGATESVMLGFFRSSAEAGLFRGAFQFAGVLQIVIFAFAASSIHLYPVFVAEQRQKELDGVYEMATRTVNTLAAFLFVVIAANRADLLRLLGNQFAPASTALLVLLVANLVQSSAGIAPFLLLVTGRPFVEMRNLLIALALGIALNLCLVPPYGVLGAAVASLLTVLTLTIMRSWQMKQLFHLTTYSRSAVTPLLVAVASVLGIALLANLLRIPDGAGMTSLAIRLPLSGIVAASLLGWVSWLRDRPSHHPVEEVG